MFYIIFKILSYYRHNIYAYIWLTINFSIKLLFFIIKRKVLKYFKISRHLNFYLIFYKNNTFEMKKII